MNRISSKLSGYRTSQKRGFIPFVTAGDPDPETSLAILLKLAEMGADVIELGVPFSDPIADGPIIQRSSQRALENGMSLDRTIELAGEFRKSSDIPVVLFSYLNPIHRYGVTSFLKAAANAGIDGVLVTDMIDEELNTFGAKCSRNGISLIRLIAPTTSDERLSQNCRNADGFVYAIARAGVTGNKTQESPQAEDLVRRARKFTDLPIGVGFGISTREQITSVWKYADAAVVGSAIVAEIAKAISSDTVVESVENYIKILLPDEFEKQI